MEDFKTNDRPSEKRTQHLALCCFLQVHRIKTPKQIDELIEIESDTGTWYKRCFVRIRTELYGVSNRPALSAGQHVVFTIGQKQGLLWPFHEWGCAPFCPGHLIFLHWDQVKGPPWDKWASQDILSLGREGARQEVLSGLGHTEVLSYFIHWLPGS